VSSTSVRRGWPSRVARVLPPIVLYEPWALFIKGLCIVSGLSTFAGPKPGSIEASLPQGWVYAWSACLVIGATAGLYGLLRPEQRRVEIAGLIWLGTASLVYGVTIAARFQAGGAVAAGIVLAFAFAAFFRALGVYVSYEIARRVVSSEAR
jgi:hypothetical protein